MAGGTTLLVDVQRINLSFPGAKPSAAEAEVTTMPPTPISAVDLTRTYHHASAQHTGSFRCQGQADPPLAFGTIGSSCSGIAVVPLPGPLTGRGKLGIINRGDIHQWCYKLTGPTTAVIDRFGTPTPIPPPGCGHFFHTYIVEYL